MEQRIQVKDEAEQPHGDDDPLQELDPYRIMSMIPLLPYQVIAVVGCGSGKFTISLGKYVFSGKVHALDSSKAVLDAVEEQRKRINLNNIELGDLKDDKLPLDDDSTDGVFAAFSLHKAANTSDLLNDAFRCLHRGGWLAILEWHRKRTKNGPPVRERLDEPKLIDLAKKTGFRLTSTHTLNDEHFMLVMRK